MADNPEESPKKGKGYPPPHGRIKAGEIRNPKGRGKAVPNVDTMIMSIGVEVIGEVEGRPYTRIENLIRKTFKRASEGDARAREMILEIWRRKTAVKESAESLDAEDQKIWEELTRAYNPTKKGGADVK